VCSCNFHTPYGEFSYFLPRFPLSWAQARHTAKATSTGAAGRCYFFARSPAGTSHSLTTLSSPAEASVLPSGLKATAHAVSPPLSRGGRPLPVSAAHSPIVLVSPPHAAS